MYIGVPHLYFGYFDTIDPSLMLNRQNVRYGLQIGKYEFREIDWSNEVVKANTIYAVPVSNLPPDNRGLKVIRGIMQTDGIEAFRIYESL
jgi:hypothetical protein